MVVLAHKATHRLSCIKHHAAQFPRLEIFSRNKASAVGVKSIPLSVGIPAIVGGRVVEGGYAIT